MARRDRYFIYVVTKALSAAPRIERLRNPASYVEGKRLSCEPIVYELRLTEATAETDAAGLAAPATG
jgi:hypothetical protein